MAASTFISAAAHAGIRDVEETPAISAIQTAPATTTLTQLKDAPVLNLVDANVSSGADPLLSRPAASLLAPASSLRSDVGNWDFSDRNGAVKNASTHSADDKPLLIPLPPAISAGSFGMAAMALLLTPRWIRRRLFA